MVGEISDARTKWIHKPRYTSFLETPVEFSSEKTSRKTSHRKQSAKHSHRFAQRTTTSRQHCDDYSEYWHNVSSAQIESTTDEPWVLQLPTLGGTDAQGQATDWRAMACEAAGQKDTSAADSGKKKKRPRGRKKRSNKQNERSFEARDLVVDIASASAIG